MDSRSFVNLGTQQPKWLPLARDSVVISVRRARNVQSIAAFGHRTADLGENKVGSYLG